MITQDQKEQIRQAFLEGELEVRTADPSSREVSWLPLNDVMCHDSEEKEILRVTLIDGRDVVVTEDHSLFYMTGEGITPVPAKSLKEGDCIVTIEGEEAMPTQISKIDRSIAQRYMYDISVPGPHNFTLTNGILAHNSYSIGGISLDIERSSKYESLKGNAESKFTEGTEAKATTTRFIRGLKQSKYGLGIRSSFGPSVGRGVLSPRNFLVLPFLFFSSSIFEFLLTGLTILS